jgi:hypothetical protein
MVESLVNHIIEQHMSLAVIKQRFCTGELMLSLYTTVAHQLRLKQEPSL